MKAIPYADRPLPNIYGGLVTYDLEKREEFIDAYLRFVDDTPTDQYSSVGWWQDYYSATDERVLLAAIANSANKKGTPQINKFLNVGGIQSNSLRSDSLANITRALDGEENLYNIWFTSAFDSDVRIINFALERNEQLVQEVLATKAPGTNFRNRAMFQPITQTMVSHSNGNNVLGLESRVARGNGVMFLVRVLIDSAEDEAIAIPLVQKLNEDITSYATELGINWNWEYLNYAQGLQHPIATYGADNIEKLRKASRKYDPDGIFQNVRGSGFKIPF
jgi:FAD/FMN-containing dehydrogenase